uniref:Peptidase_M13_N domain-containing protein n=1 Tax=Panagrellus redivivus TaxID=6233 RepID=A0A7E4ZUS7_PANRE
MAECQPKRKSRMPSKSCITLLIPVFIVCVVVAMLWGRQSTETFVADSKFETIDKPTTADFQNRVCTNQDCVSAAALIAQNMDQKADPCNDTVAFACGNYGLHHDPLNAMEMCPMIDLSYRVRREVLRILTKPASSSDKPWHALPKWYYQKCMNKPEKDATAKKALLTFLEEIGGWPLLDPQWTEFTTSWEEYIATVMQKFYVGAVVLTSIGVNPTNTSEVVLQLKPQPFDFFSPSYFNSTALFLGAEDGSFNRDLDTFSHVSTNLQTSQHNSDDEEVAGPLYLVQQQFPNFDIEKYVRTVLDGIVEVSPNTTVVVNNKGYFANLHKIVSSKRDLANYVASVVAMRFRSEPYGDMVEIQKGSERDSFCFFGATQLFKMPLTQMFLQNSNFDVEVRPKVKEMVANIK